MINIIITFKRFHVKSTVARHVNVYFLIALMWQRTVRYSATKVTGSLLADKKNGETKIVQYFSKCLSHLTIRTKVAKRSFREEKRHFNKILYSPVVDTHTTMIPFIIL